MTDTKVGSLWQHINSLKYVTKVVAVTDNNVFLESDEQIADLYIKTTFTDYWRPYTPQKKYKVWVYVAKNGSGYTLLEPTVLNDNSYELKAILTGKDGDGL